eukprot:GHUV01035361.1.p1 GENE.GHUV01035361.1~~GHUV01035361.1.p1  ORF type:complete len:101 (-),score=27.66 GHUV01035361.1:177-479(-)
MTAARRRYPLYATITLQLLAEVINSRLFTTVRDSLGLTYDVSFEVRGQLHINCSMITVFYATLWLLFEVGCVVVLLAEVINRRLYTTEIAWDLRMMSALK